ncbi:MAG: hypothetical protein HKN87_09365 [Saprospiraceae bacterium]|nr:hypothetical protein [Saprospiraceae bacterium]
MHCEISQYQLGHWATLHCKLSDLLYSRIYLEFFNLLRRNLVDKGNLKRYLIYAIGEIVLVVLGILIALQINNWNQNRLPKKQEIDILKYLRDELGDNLTLFDMNYKRHEDNVNAIQQLLKAGNSDLAIESLDSMFNKMLEASTFDPSEAVYNSIINSGKIEYISNDHFRNRIAKLQDLMEDFKEEEISMRKLNLESFFPYYIHDMTYNPMSLSDVRWS